MREAKCWKISSSEGLKNQGDATSAASAPASFASLVSWMVSRVPMAPVPAMTLPRLPNFSFTMLIRSFRSSAESSGASPVLAFTTSPETPAPSQKSIRPFRAPPSISPWWVKGVTLGTNIPLSSMESHAIERLDANKTLTGRHFFT